MSVHESNRLPAGIRGAAAPVNGNRLIAEHSFVIRGSVDAVFRLLDPVSERDWVDDWDPIPVYPPELSRDAGTVFTLVRDGRTAVWTTLTHSMAEHVTEFLVTEYDYQQRRIEVRCTAESADTTRVDVRYTTTALSPDGQRDIGRYGETFLKAWQAPLQQAIDRAGNPR